MESFNKIQEYIYEYGKKIGAPLSLMKIYNSEQSDGVPFVQVCNNSYKYIFMERGFKFDEWETDNLDELLFWIMRDKVFSISSKYEFINRIDGEDSRRVLFSKQLQLMSILNLEWWKKMNEEIQEILRKSPYSD